MRLRSPAGYVLALSLWLGALGLVLWIWTGSSLPPLLSGLGALGALLIGLAGALGATGPEGPRYGRDASVGTVVVSIGIAVAVTGAAFGVWLVLIGAEVIAFGGYLVLRETASGRDAG